jgi:outer membrane protein TolC
LTSQFTHTSLKTFTNGKRNTWTIGAQLTWHIFDGGARYGERRTNTALLAQSRLQLEQAERDALMEVRQSTRGVMVAKKGLEVAQESQRIATANAKLARSKYINGTGTSFDMVDTQRTARQTTIDVTVKEFELLRAEIIAFLALASCEI